MTRPDDATVMLGAGNAHGAGTAAATVALSAAGAARGASAPDALPRLLRGVQDRSGQRLQTHVQSHGPLPMFESRGGGRLRRRERSLPLADELERAGLLGRGGAAFPTATKLRAVAASRGRSIVVVNGVEAEPPSLKDKTLLELAPHLVLDGAVLAADCLGAEEIVVALCEHAVDALASVGAAIAEREAAGGEPPMTLVSVPEQYVAGQESALISWVNGGRAKPTFTPPMPFEQGVARRPTLVSNVETLGHVALIARHGARWFRALGTPSQPGSTLITLSGPVATPGVYEIECGTSLSALIEAAGGATSPVGAALVGGYAGGWIAGAHLRGVALSDEHLAVHRAALGAGAVVLLSQQACPVAETARLARWMAGQSAGQCGPCVHGLDALATEVGELALGRGGRGTSERIDRLAALTERRGACRHPDGAVRMVLSALEAFRHEFAEHARRGPCEACRRGTELALPQRPVSDRAARERR